MYGYLCSFYPAYLSENEDTLQLFSYLTSGFVQKFRQPLLIGHKVAIHAFYDQGANSFNPIDYYPRKFKNFPEVEYRYGIVLDLVVQPTSEYKSSNYSSALIALVTADERLLSIPDMRFIEHPNPSVKTLNW